MNSDIKGVVIDAGHGGVDTGNSSGSFNEKDLSLQISQYMYDRLKALNIPVALTRDTDETLDRDERVERAISFFGNGNDVILISNHVGSGTKEGAEVIYALRNTDTLARLISSALEQEGQVVEKYYQRRLPDDTSKDYYYIHRLTGDIQPILIEYGSIENESDLNRITTNLENYAEAVVRAIVQYIGGDYTIPEGSTSNVYIVQRGDSLYSIANRFGVTVTELRERNNLTTDNLSIGQYLIIPTKEEEKPEEPSSDYLIYTVQSGDTLYKIANKYNVSVDDIIEVNQLPNTSLSINQQLLIPTTSTSLDEKEGITYVVQSGDSLWKIASKYNLTVDEIKTANNLTSNLLNIGDVLFIPFKQDLPVEESFVSYTVQSGDSLYSIAKKFGVTVDEIKSLNNMGSNLLSIGQILRIPTSTPNQITYIVQSGDSLYSIAKKFNVSVDDIKRANNLTSNLLSIGQNLIIPS